MKNNVETVDAKHIFLDIVGYTHKRSVEAQSELITVLNKIVVESIESFQLEQDQDLYIPTGDGLCISIINIVNPYDIHISIALEILSRLYKYNENVKDDMRRFSLRIGINENIDNLITDINGKENISGSGINYASRIEGLCDENQILVGNPVFEKLVQREKYINAFISFTANVKHGLPLKVHQYKNDSLPFLNNQTPSQFRPIEKPKLTLPKLIGYYFANSVKNEEFYVARLKAGAQSPFSLRLLNFYLAEDSFEKSKATKIKPAYRKKIKRSTIQEEFEYFQSVDFWIICDLSSFIIDNYLIKFSEFFDGEHLFLNERGLNKLHQEHHDICEEFGID